MTLSDLSIKRPVFAWMLMGGLIFFGLIGFLRMGISQLPSADFPVISISVTQQGAAPEVMEMDIVDILENAVMTIQGVRSVRSTSYDSAASIVVEFELDRNIDLALQDVQAKVQQAQRFLPKSMDPPVITKSNPDDVPILWMALHSDTLPLKDLMTYVRDNLKDEFTTVPGVGDVLLGGYVDPNLRIWVSHRALDRYYMTVNDVIDTVAKQNIEPPAGYLDTATTEYNVRTLGEVGTADRFARLNMITRGALPNYSPIKLGQVARVEEGLADIRRISRAQGRPAIGLGVLKQRGSNEVAVARAVKQKLEQVRKNLPRGMALDLQVDNTRFIEQSVDDMNLTLVLAALLTGLVCWIFLGSWTSTLNVWLAIPTSVMGTFLILYFAGFTLNTFTLMALTLVIGIVVDDAIMMQENISRHLEGGQKSMPAAIFGAREITFAAIAASIALVAIFLPVAFMRGVIGQFFFQFGVTLSAAVMLSLLEAVTLTPMRASRFVTYQPRSTWFGRGVDALFNATRAGYRRLLAVTLRHRWAVVAGSLLFFAASLFSVGKLNKEFVPSMDMSLFLMQLKTPVGSSLEFTNAKFRLVEDYLSRRPEVTRYYTAVGGFAGGIVNTGFIFVSLKPPGRRGVDPAAGHELSQKEIMNRYRRVFGKIPDVKIVIQDLSSRGFSSSRGFPVEFTVQGPDWGNLAAYAQAMMTGLKKTGLVTDVDTDYQSGQPEIQIVPDREKAAARGVDINAIGEIVNFLIAGDVVGTYPKGGHRYDIRVKLDPAEMPQGGDMTGIIKKLYVRNNRGELTRLSEVVDIRQVPTLEVITRLNRERSITVSANVAEGKSQQAALQAAEDLGKKILPPAYHISITGSAQTFQQSFDGLLLALFLGIIISYMVLGTQFNSFLHPLSVLMALPFSVSGAFLALLLTHQSLNIYSMIGLILLMGIVKKNSILLVDFTNQVRQKSAVSVHDALLEACPVRLRPILMTSIAIIAGALPAALSLGPGAASRIPMSVAVIGGVLVSTFLTLLVVPSVYSLLAHWESREAHKPFAETEAGKVFSQMERMP